MENSRSLIFVKPTTVICYNINKLTYLLTYLPMQL